MERENSSDLFLGHSEVWQTQMRSVVPFLLHLVVLNICQSLHRPFSTLHAFVAGSRWERGWTLPQSSPGAGETFHSTPISYSYFLLLAFLVIKGMIKGREGKLKLPDGMCDLWFSIALCYFVFPLSSVTPGAMVGICITNSSWDHRPIIRCLYPQGEIIMANSAYCISDIMLSAYVQ